MRKAFRHTGVLMMLSVVALGLIGAAYALWFEDVQLAATVSTGTFDADMSIHPWSGSAFGGSQTAEGNYVGAGHPVVAVFTSPITSSRSAGNNPYSAYGDFPTAKLDAAPHCDAAMGHFGHIAVNANDAVDSNRLNLTMSGLFPYAGCEYQFDIHNSGSVPLHIDLLANSLYQKCDINGNNCENINISWPAISVLSDPANGPACARLFDTDGIWNRNATPPNLITPGQVTDGQGNPVQLHQGQELKCTVKIILDQAYDGENSVYKVEWNWRTYQWNEVPGTGTYPAPAFRDGVNGPFDGPPTQPSPF